MVKTFASLKHIKSNYFFVSIVKVIVFSPLLERKTYGLLDYIYF